MAKPNNSSRNRESRQGDHADQVMDAFVDFIERFFTVTVKCAYLMLKEAWRAVCKREVPWAMQILLVSCLYGSLHFFLDFKLFLLFDAADLYPGRIHPVLYDIYWWTVLTSGLWGWLFYRVCKRTHEEKRWERAFISAGLKNKFDQTPKLLDTYLLNEKTVEARFLNGGFAREAFTKAQSTLEACLRVYIDSIEEDIAKGTIGIRFSKEPMPTQISYSNRHIIAEPGCFTIGEDRSEIYRIDLRETPHLLIAGETSSGKSTFLRQAIVSLYRHDPDCQFTLIDLKAGLEFQIFKGLPRVSVVGNIDQALAKLRGLDDELSRRLAELGRRGVKDIAALEGKCDESPLKRHVIVIDEAAEIFLPGARNPAAAQARAIVSRITRQARAAGIHVLIGTQRPDARAIDMQIKANLTAKLCFQVADHASSLVVLGHGGAKNLPSIPGRAIWQHGLTNKEIQTPLLDVDEAIKLLEKTAKVIPLDDSPAREGRAQDTATGAHDEGEGEPSGW